MASISSSASRAVRARSTTGPVDCALTGSALLTNPYFNRGTGFTAEERVAFGLSGLLPSRVNSLTSQAGRAYEQYLSRPSALNRNTFMTSLKDQNEVLFYRVVGDHIKEMFPIIYTPTEGDAIANYSRLFRRPEGCFLNIEEQDDIEEALDKWGDPEDVDIICCSDGEQILGMYRCRMLIKDTLTRPRYRRSGRGRHSHQYCKAGHLHALRRHSSQPHPARRSRRWHEQPGSARGPALPGLDPPPRAGSRV